LACALCQRLGGEEETEFTPAVQDALGEVVNMICGNAKAEFAKRGIYYKLSTPFIIVGRDQMIATLGEKPFLTSFYWTNEGLFELSFSLYRTGNVAPAG
ncbi:MAG TPA: chemotaxis protein CheX, partial [Candidatus Aminicenantes bacterium]|nr:chemotaxis protein CheX [Candidatus Aminicenantes bacterium]